VWQSLQVGTCGGYEQFVYCQDWTSDLNREQVNTIPGRQQRLHTAASTSVTSTATAGANSRRKQTASSISLDSVRNAISGAQDYLIELQDPEGYWLAELEGDTILESEYILLLQFLGRREPAKFKKLANYIRRKQHQDGYWPIYAGGPPDVSASVKAYFACKLAGHSSNEPFMRRARKAILAEGGVTHCNTFTKLYLSMFGQYDWHGVPTIPPEAILLPKWFYFNIYNMSSWSRAILVPLAVMNAAKPHRPIPSHAHIDELFVGGRDRKRLRLEWDRKAITWRNVFLVFDRLLKMYDASPLKPFRKRALNKSLAWLLDREENSGGLGAIFPAMTHAIMAYKCMGLPDHHPAISKELAELAAFEIEEADTVRMQPCISPVWDTALVVNSLIDSGYPADSQAITKACEWLLSKQTRRKGDWSVKCPNVEPGGWYFEMENEYYPDVDDTIMVLMGPTRPTARVGSTGRRRQHTPEKRCARVWIGSLPCKTRMAVGPASIKTTTKHSSSSCLMPIITPCWIPPPQISLHARWRCVRTTVSAKAMSECARLWTISIANRKRMAPGLAGGV